MGRIRIKLRGTEGNISNGYSITDTRLIVRTDLKSKTLYNLCKNKINTAIVT